MNSRSGMSTPVVSRSTVTTMPGFGPVAELADPLQRPVDAAGDLGDERLAAAEDVARLVDELVGVGGVRQVVGREDERLREPAVLGLVRIGVALELCRIRRLESGAVISRSTAEASNARSSSSRSSWLAPVSGSTSSTCSPSLRKMPLIRTSERTRDHVVVDEVAVADGTVVVVAVGKVLEVGHRVGGRGRGQADLDRVEVVERVAPDRPLPGRVAAVALVGDDQVEGVDRDVELLDVGLDRLAVDRQRSPRRRTGSSSSAGSSRRTRRRRRASAWSAGSSA